MRKRAVLATPSLAVGLALSSFAASVVKEEEKKRKKLRAAAAAARSVHGRDDGGNQRVDGDGSGEECSSNGTPKKRKRPIADGDDADGVERLRTSSLAESATAAGTSLSEEDGGQNNGAEEALEGIYFKRHMMRFVIRPVSLKGMTIRNYSSFVRRRYTNRISILYNQSDSLGASDISLCRLK